MAKKESTLVNLVLTLFIICFVASATLGFMYVLTKEPIAAAKAKKINNAIQQVLPMSEINARLYKELQAKMEKSSGKERKNIQQQLDSVGLLSRFDNDPTQDKFYRLVVSQTNDPLLQGLIFYPNSDSSEFFSEPLDNTKLTKYSAMDYLEFYPASRSGQLVGVAIKTFSDIGFGSRIELMIGFRPDGTIQSTSVIKHAETPGLGDKMDKDKSEWSNQFDEKNPNKFKLKVKKDGGDVDAITASTISSRAFCDATKRAFEAFIINNDSIH